MPGKLKIKLTFGVEQAEADGSECMACGDRIYLGAGRIVAYHLGRRTGEIPKLLCMSCADAFAQYLEEKEKRTGG
jgi:hypothetical protein